MLIVPLSYFLKMMLVKVSLPQQNYIIHIEKHTQ